jgi:uncharacterized protein (DUF488 family)
MAVIFTIGHSTHSISDFINLLLAYDIRRLIDIRTIPKSRHNPQFNEGELRRSLEASHIEYARLPSLGGLRRTTKHSLNTGWRNASFRGFADYMQTEEFKEGIEQLRALAAEKTSVIMCAEAVPWRCHRSLVGDALIVRGECVKHIYDVQTAKEHQLTPFARVDGLAITYPKSYT